MSGGDGLSITEYGEGSVYLEGHYTKEELLDALDYLALLGERAKELTKAIQESHELDEAMQEFLEED